MEAGWTTGSSLTALGISTHVEYKEKPVQLFRSARRGRVNYTDSTALNVKLWPRFKINR